MLNNLISTREIRYIEMLGGIDLMRSYNEIQTSHNLHVKDYLQQRLMSNTVLEMVVGGSSKDKHSRPYPLCHMARCTKARRPIQVQPFNLHTVLFLSLFLYYYSCNATHLTVKNQLINSAFIKIKLYS